MLQTEHSIELLQTSYIERMCKDIFDIESENDSVTTPFDPKVNLSKDDVPASAAERAKLSQLAPLPCRVRQVHLPEAHQA